jgi:hypothetical protein
MQGNLISRLLDGSMPSYQTLLHSAAATDSLRVVDGELDNTYQPARKRSLAPAMHRLDGWPPG